jgi:hypothetical protein
MSGLSERAVRNILSYLIREGIVRRRASLTDARERIYSLPEVQQ